MKLQDFLKELFSQEAVKCFEIGQLEVDVGIKESSECDGLITLPTLVVGVDCPCAKITIVPLQRKAEDLNPLLKVENEQA